MAKLACLAVLMALALCLTAHGAKVTKFEFTRKYRTVRLLSGFDVATFVVELDQDLTLSGIPLSMYSYEAGNATTAICLTDSVCGALPLVTELLMGSFSMTCTAPGNKTVDISSLWEDGFPPLSNWPLSSRVPSFLIPMGGVQDATSALFHSLGLAQFPDLTRSSRRLSFLLFLGLSHSEGPIPLRPSPLTNADLSSCVMRVNSTAELLYDGQPLQTDTTGVTATPLVLPCTYVASQRSAGEMRKAIIALDITEKSTLERSPWSIAALSVTDSLWSCLEQAKFANAPRFVSRYYNSTLCAWAPGTPEWNSDPCCNLVLTYTMCCRSRTAEAHSEVFPSLETLPESALPAQCRFRDQLAVALMNMASTLNAAEDMKKGCSVAASVNVNTELYLEFFTFVETCDAQLLPLGVEPNPSISDPRALGHTACSDDSPCLDGVPCVDGECRPPLFTSQFEELYVQCLLANMPATVRRLFQIRFKLPAVQTADEFRASFETHMFGENCIGGWQAYILNHDYSTSPPTYIAANRTQCEGYLECTQSKQVNPTSSNCPSVSLDGNTGFCATCPYGGSRCRNTFPDPAGCYLYGETTAKCASMGGKQIVGRACFLPNVTLAECLPPSVCPIVSTVDTSSEIASCYLSFCYSPQLNATTCNAASAKLKCQGNATVPACVMSYQWSTAYAGGKGLCRHPLIKQAQCPGQWRDSRTWYWGIANTPEKCQAGVCSVDGVLDATINRTACLEGYKCSQPCRSCEGSHTDLLAACTKIPGNGTVCTTVEKTYGTGLCTKNLGRSACALANYTYSRCSDLSVDECALCDFRTGNFSICPPNKLTRLPSIMLGCGIPDEPYRACANQSVCVKAGACDRLYDNVALPTSCVSNTRGFYPFSFCTGVCVIPFVIDASGTPTCPAYMNATLYKNGCHSLAIGNPTSCKSRGYVWTTLPHTEDACVLSDGFGCFENAASIAPSKKNYTECAACNAGRDMSKIYRRIVDWSPGQWLPGKIIQENWQWKPLGVQKPLTWGRTLDRGLLRSTLADFAASRFGPFLRSELLCRYSPLASALTPTSCSCDPTGPAKCFDGAVTAVSVGMQRFCAGIGDNVRMGIIFLRIAIDTVPDFVGCLDFNVGLTAARQFRRDIATLSSTDISSLTLGGIYSVVKNSLGSTVGQLQSDGAELDWTGDLSNDFTLCLDGDNTISVESRFTELDFAVLQSSASANASASVFTPLDGNVTRSSDGQYCLSVRTPGTYFVIRRLPGWRDIAPSVLTTPLAIIVVLAIESALFGLLCLFSAFSFFYAIMYGAGFWWIITPQKVILLFIFEFAGIRCAWLALSASGESANMSQVGASILSELPIFTTYSIFTTLIIFWMRTTGGKLGRTFSAKAMAIPCFAVNTLLYLFYAAMLISFETASIDNKPAISIAYKIVLAVVSVVTVALFWMAGVRLLLLLKKWEDKERRSQRIHMTVAVSFESLCLVGQVAFLLAGAGVTGTAQEHFAWVVVFVFYPLIELVPFSILCHLLYGNVVRHKKLQASSSGPMTYARTKGSRGGSSGMGGGSRDTPRDSTSYDSPPGTDLSIRSVS